ncbi:MAG: DUF4384 domain-containing protein [Nitrospinae bacterium]|nr:DUF4384 domain-containing protein [Nitrospinota bacterium]
MPLQEGASLTENDNYLVTVLPKQKSFLYIYQVDSRGQSFKLFPNSDFSPHSNPIIEKEYRIPNGKEILYLDNNKGMETIYVILSREPLPQLDNFNEGTGTQMESNIKKMGVGGTKTVKNSYVSYKGEDGKTVQRVIKTIESNNSTLVSQRSFIHQ